MREIIGYRYVPRFLQDREHDFIYHSNFYPYIARSDPAGEDNPPAPFCTFCYIYSTEQLRHIVDLGLCRICRAYLYRHGWGHYLTPDVVRISYRDFLRHTRTTNPGSIYSMRLRPWQLSINRRRTGKCYFYKSQLLNYQSGNDAELDRYIADTNLAPARLTEAQQLYLTGAI